MLEKGGIGYFSSPVFRGFAVEHAFLSRAGGVSRPPFASLNFDERDTDPKENIKENRLRVSRAFSVPMDELVLVNQVHGDKVHAVNGANKKEFVEADAIVTDEPMTPIGIMTADCLPVLIYDPVRRIVGASHGGWKGTALGVVIKTVEAMKALYGSEPKDLLAAMGPYIGPCCYAVKENVTAEFERAFGKDPGFIKKNDGDTRLDIAGANLEQLTSMGLKSENITGAAPCTSCNSHLFFSYRKDGGRTGRQVSFIMLRHR